MLDPLPFHVCGFPPVLEAPERMGRRSPQPGSGPLRQVTAPCVRLPPALCTLPAHHHPEPTPPQINLNESMQVVSRRVVTVAYGEPVHHVMQFDPADPGYLYLMTSHQVRPVPRPDKVPG